MRFISISKICGIKKPASISRVTGSEPCYIPAHILKIISVYSAWSTDLNHISKIGAWQTAIDRQSFGGHLHGISLSSISIIDFCISRISAKLRWFRWSRWIRVMQSCLFQKWLYNYIYSTPGKFRGSFISWIHAISFF